VITRRDFLNGTALTLGASILPPRLLRAFESGGDVPGVYPPGLTGLRGSHDGSWEVAHALRDGAFWRMAGEPVDTGESYDLVVVGGGLSGLSAAWFFREAVGPGARVLILDNHDDFGGHAKRNEFEVDGRKLIAHGGTWSIDSPAPYSAEAKRLVSALGIDVSSFPKHVDRELLAHLQRGTFYDRETFGADRLVLGQGRRPWKEYLAEVPVPDRVRADLLRLHVEARDWMPGLSEAEKKHRLARMSYAAFLTDVVGLDPGVVPFFGGRLAGLYGVGIEAIPARDCAAMDLPGFEGMGLSPSQDRGMNLDTVSSDEARRYFFHFPDGNATLARLLVRSLLGTGVVPGQSAEDSMTARVDYARLDEPGSTARIRLSSTAVRVRHAGDPGSARGVEVAYSRGGKLEQVSARGCVMACWHAVIPWVCPEVPEAQREALRYGAKVPLVYTSVALRNRKAFEERGVQSVSLPGGYHDSIGLVMPVSVGDYAYPRTPDEPVVAHLTRVPGAPGQPAREQHRMGRLDVLTTPFDAFESHIRDEMSRVLGPGGFDPDRDIAAITVNRWPHGYAYQYNSLDDAFWLDGGELPCAVARRPVGRRITIANSDAAAYAYTDAAIDQARRAVSELVERI